MEKSLLKKIKSDGKVAVLLAIRLMCWVRVPVAFQIFCILDFISLNKAYRHIFNTFYLY
jgi:hypothetical protein